MHFHIKKHPYKCDLWFCRNTPTRKRGGIIMKKKMRRRLACLITAALMAFVSVMATPMDIAAEDIAVSDELIQQSIELYPNGEEGEQIVTLDGLMPENAEVTVEDVSEEHGAIAAFDITITDENDNEFQPDEKAPIYVEITAPELVRDKETIELWHVTDEGEREQITDFTLENGTISFFAAAFSVYEIVNTDMPTEEDNLAASLADLTGSRAQDGFYIYYTTKSGESFFMTSGLNGSNCFIEDKEIENGAVWKVEKVGDDYRLYTEVGGVNKYIRNTSANLVGLTEDPSQADLLTITKVADKPGGFVVKKKDENKWLQHSGGGKGMRYWTDKNNVENSTLYFKYSDTVPLPFDYYELGGKTFGIMQYNTGASLGSALMADSAGDFYESLYKVDSLDADHNSHMLYVSEDFDITEWTFTCVDGDRYIIEAEAEEYYLSLNNSMPQLVLTENEASVFKVIPSKNDSIKLKCVDNDKFLTYSNADSTFIASAEDTEENNLYFVGKTNVTVDDNITMTAQRISVSEGGLNGQELIVYTRLWNDVDKKYEFYAIDHDGSLRQVYAYGDKIMWLDDALNTLLWEYTIYTNPDGSENGYYELRNTFSGMYLAPQMTSNQIITNRTIGLLMPGRKYKEEANGTITYGEYYTDIIAWDTGYYEYIGVQADKENGVVKPSSTSRASSFYFATFDTMSSNGGSVTATLHPVTTVDNTEHGIVMKMIDFDGLTPSTTAANGSVVTGDYLDNNYQDGKQRPVSGLLKPMLDENNHPIVASNGKDLGNAFADAQLTNHLFIQSVYDSSGYFEFDSCQNYATLVPEGVPLPGNPNRTPDCYVTATGQVVSEEYTNGVQNTPMYDFTVYRELGTQDGRFVTTSKHGQFYAYNYLLPGKYSKDNPYNLYGANADREHPEVGMLSDDDPRKYEKLFLVQNNNPNVTTNVNYYFGMEMEAQFVQTPSGLDAWGHDIIFEFTGDDDFWLFVDGHLVLDLGGIHSAIGGSVNFRTGQVNVAGQQKTLRQLFEQNYRTMNPGITDAEVAEYLAGIFDPDNPEVFTDYSTHHMKIYYMERGGGASNLHMRFNLSSVTPGDILFQKEITGIHPEDDMDFSLVQFPIQIFYKIADNTEWVKLRATHGENNEHVSVTYQNSTQTVRFEESYEPPGVNGALVYDNVFFITPGKNIEIHFPDEAMHYMIKECAVNTEIYETVDTAPIDDVSSVVHVGTVYRDYMTPDSLVSNRPVVSFDNVVKENRIRSLNITKRLYDESYDEYYTPGAGMMTKEEYRADHELRYDASSDPPASDVDNTTFSYRLYLSDGYHETMSPADMHRYYVLDPNSRLCRWDPANKRFIPFEKGGVYFTDATDPALTVEDVERVTFYTSRYGSISNIPTGYTVKVPGLIVGTRFMVEERDYEIPLGYDLVEFECDTAIINGQHQVDSSYKVIHNDPAANDHSEVGEILSTSNAYMFVDNRRGFGIEGDKIWSDRDFASSHGDIFTAIYLTGENTPLANTVRQLKSPDTSVKYFFKQLLAGYSISDYHVYEVTLTNPQFDANGDLVSYDSVTRLSDGDTLSQHEVTDFQNVTTQDDYNVSYSEGEPRQTGTGANAVNIRADSIMNTRKGGLEIYLYEWNNVIDPNDPNYADIPLERGKFEVYKKGQNDQDWTLLGEFTSDEEGIVTILYGIEDQDQFRIVQTYTPKAYDSDLRKSYVGIPNAIQFTVIQDTVGYIIDPDSWNNPNDPPEQNMTDDDTDPTDGKNWAEYTSPYRPSPTSAAMAGRINIYNKPFTLQVKKVHGISGMPLEGVEFALHKDYYFLGGLQESLEALPGYTRLVTDENGVIPKIDETLAPLDGGYYYYLRETKPLAGYEGLPEDIKFNVSDIGVISCANPQYLEEHEVVIGNTLHIIYTISVPNITALDYYFDIEKIAFIDKNIHTTDDTQKFVFRVDRFAESETDFGNRNILDTFYVTLNCEDELVPDGEGGYTIGGNAYNYDLYTTADTRSAARSYYLESGSSVKIKKTYNTSEVYTYPTAIRHGVQTVNVRQSGIYRVTELTDWSSTDYDFWNGSNILKGGNGAAPIGQGTSCTTRGNPSVIFSVTDLRADDYEHSTYVEPTTLQTSYRPTASFTNSETEYAYLSAQTYAENTITCKTKQQQGGG